MARFINAWFHEVVDTVVGEAADTIRKCGIVVAATDTLYGLLADPYRDECVLKIYRLKERPLDKPIPILAADAEHVVNVTRPSPQIRRFLDMIWPGPVTVILGVSEGFFSKYISPSGRIGFRVPAAPLVRRLAVMNKGFVTGTSANLSGHKPPRTIHETYRMLGGGVELYIDQGPAPIGAPSTVIDIVNGELKLVREGAVTIDTLRILWRLSSRT